MMISPEAFITEYQDKPFTELLLVRDELIQSIRDFETHKQDQVRMMIRPSPDVVYQCNLKYLAKLCILIAKKYNREVVWQEAEDE